MKSVIKAIFALTLVMATTLMNDKIALAKAYYAGKLEMIDNSEIIAVVEIKKIEQAQAKGMTWTYADKATVVPLKVLKGNLSDPATIYGAANFICGHVNLQPGKTLVFLNHDGDLLVGSNWHLSIRPIKDDLLDWYDGQSMSPLKPAKLDLVVKEVDAHMGSDPKLEKLEEPLKTLASTQVLCDREVGDSNQPSKVWLAYQKALEQAAQHKTSIKEMLKNASPAGRVYAAMLLYKADREEGKQALARLSTCSSTTFYKSGCVVDRVGVWQVASDLYGKGKYLTLSLDNFKP